MKKLLLLSILFYSINFSVLFDFVGRPAELTAGEPYRLSIQQRDSHGRAYSYPDRGRRYQPRYYGRSLNRSLSRRPYSQETIQDFGDDRYIFDSRGNISFRLRTVGNSVYIFNRSGNIVKIIRY